MQSLCEQCGESFVARPRSKGRFCSRECHRQWQKDNAYAVKTCAHCGKEFRSPTTRNATCCSAKCRKQYDHVTCNCLTCGREFTKIRSNPKKYCSHKCFAQGYVPDSKLPPMHCEVCDKEIKHHRKKNRRFCSQKCFGQWKTTITGEDHPMFAKLECTCEQCGKTFFAQRSHVLAGKVRFCSKDCHNAHGQTEYTCKNCNKTFKDARKYADSNRRQFCGRKCQREYNNRIHVCRHCKKEFPVPKSTSENGGGVYCSRKCLREYHKLLCTCEQCHKEFVTTAGNADARFCSLNCRYKWQSKTSCGENNFNYKGGYKSYYGPSWYKARRKARKRDNYTCQHCGITEKKLKRQLDVHHLQAFRTFSYIPGENDLHLAANAQDNLISLCHSCHMKAENEQIPIQPYLI